MDEFYDYLHIYENGFVVVFKKFIVKDSFHFAQEMLINDMITLWVVWM